MKLRDKQEMIRAGGWEIRFCGGGWGWEEIRKKKGMKKLLEQPK